MNLLQSIKIAATLVSPLISAVKAIEAEWPEGGKGAEKLAILRSILEDAIKMTTDLKEKFEDIWPVAERVVAGVVGFLKRVGTFKSK